MTPQIIKLKVLTALFLFCIPAFLATAADKPADVLHVPGDRYSSSESRQHYLQGKDYYSAGRYEEARSEFGKALESVSPPKLVTESPQAQPKNLEIIPFKAPAVPKGKAVEKKKEEQIKSNKAGAPSIEEPQQTKEYYIDAGDVLDISVWQIADLSKPEVIVRPDGRISFPLIGDISAEGLTLTQLGSIITEKLKVYVKAPQVSIMIRRFGDQTNKVSILGEVPTPGVYRFSSPPSIAEVVASAGGYTKYAVINSVMIIRGDVRTGAKPEVIRINLVDILKGNKLSRNIFLRANDIVYIPRSFIGNLNTFMELIQPGISEYMQYMDARRFHNIMHRNAQ